MTIPQSETVRRRANHLTGGRKFNAEELLLLLLWFLNEAPAHGYDLISRIGRVSGGFYSPSPGVVYPALGQLEAQGLSQVEATGKRKNYRITPAGKEYLQARESQAQLLLSILRHAARKMLWVNGASESSAAEATGWLPEFVRARRAFQAILLAKSDADHAEQRRLIAILERAALEITGAQGDREPSIHHTGE